MPIEPLSKLWSRGTFPGLSEWLSRRPQTSLFTGCAGSSDAFLIAGLFSASGRTVLVLVESGKQAEVLSAECASLLGEDSVSLFPSRDAVPYNMKSPFGPVVESRYTVLSALLDGKKAVYIAPHAALLQKVPPPRELFNRIIRLNAGRDISIPTLSSWLADNGFRRETMVADVGTFCIRGGIVDIYPFMTDGPVRVEFFGDVIESIREFDVFSQKTSRSRESVEIFPMKEHCLGPETVERGLAAMQEYVAGRRDLEGGLSKLSHQWKTLLDHDGIEWFLHWFGLAEASLLDYLPSDAIAVWDDLLPPERRLDECVQNYERHLERVSGGVFGIRIAAREASGAGQGGRGQSFAVHPRVRGHRRCRRTSTGQPRARCPSSPRSRRRWNRLPPTLRRHNAAGDETIMVCGNEGHAERLLELIGESCPFVKVCVGLPAPRFYRQNKQTAVLFRPADVQPPAHAADRAQKGAARPAAAVLRRAVARRLCGPRGPRHRQVSGHRARRRPAGRAATACSSPTRATRG